jgi:hypothetical protein
MFDDFEEFKTSISWFIKPADRIEIGNGNVMTKPEFANTFPTLNQLIQTARTLDIKINSDSYKLYSWTTKGKVSCGWLCKFELPNLSKIDILPEHQLLLDNVGGIKESYNQPEGAFSNNQNFLFIKSECKRGAGYWTDYYHDMCEEEGITPMSVDNLISFVYEANGGQTLYDLNTKQVYLFSHDHSFDYVTFMDKQPKYTFHYINDVKDFIDYAECFAEQWLKHIEQ